ncbi:hypothetical protein KIW84_025496 [Lathyrus oleraceus]|uniref:Uncharacterized protein n=1 Tax=Pisum sativum TaxID=3888 RepID=A0A9D4YMY2_PEA|nr:hypothetical protein KIW84_025496 [Pisum sativum]
MNDENNKDKVVFAIIDMRYKLEVLGVDGKFRARFVFWDIDCVKLMGKSSLEPKRQLIEVGEDNPLEFPYPLDAKKELHTSKLHVSEPSSHDELPC